MALQDRSNRDRDTGYLVPGILVALVVFFLIWMFGGSTRTTVDSSPPSVSLPNRTTP